MIQTLIKTIYAIIQTPLFSCKIAQNILGVMNAKIFGFRKGMSIEYAIYISALGP